MEHGGRNGREMYTYLPFFDGTGARSIEINGFVCGRVVPAMIWRGTF